MNSSQDRPNHFLVLRNDILALIIWVRKAIARLRAGKDDDNVLRIRSARKTHRERWRAVGSKEEHTGFLSSVPAPREKRPPRPDFLRARIGSEMFAVSLMMGNSLSFFSSGFRPTFGACPNQDKSYMFA